MEITRNEDAPPAEGPTTLTIRPGEGGDELQPHTATKIIGQVLAEIDGRPE